MKPHSTRCSAMHCEYSLCDIDLISRQWKHPVRSLKIWSKEGRIYCWHLQWIQYKLCFLALRINDPIRLHMKCLVNSYPIYPYPQPLSLHGQGWDTLVPQSCWHSWSSHICSCLPLLSWLYYNPKFYIIINLSKMKQSNEETSNPEA